MHWSRAIIEAFKMPGNDKKGVITVDGKMVERLHLVMAKRTVAIAEAIGEMNMAEAAEGRS